MGYINPKIYLENSKQTNKRKREKKEITKIYKIKKKDKNILENKEKKIFLNALTKPNDPHLPPSLSIIKDPTPTITFIFVHLYFYKAYAYQFRQP